MPGHIEWFDDGNHSLGGKIIIEAGIDPATGKRKRQKYRFHGSEKQTKLELARLLTLQEQGLLVDPSKMTVAEYFEKWLADYAKLETEATTYYRYQEIIRKDIIPSLGQIRIQKLRPLHIQNFYTKMRTEGKKKKRRIEGELKVVVGPLSEATVGQYHAIIHCALECAVEWLIAPQNVADHVRSPKKKKRKVVVGVNCYNFEQAIMMLKAAPESPWHIQVVLATLTGMRRGEIYGTRLQDIDFEAGTITTNKAAQYVPGEKLPDKLPKDDEVRVIDVAELVLDILKAYRAKLNEQKLKAGEEYLNPDGHLCVDEKGRRLHPDTISKEFPKWIVSLGLPRIRFHDLRHTHASLMLADTPDLKLVSARLGHSGVGITGDLYSHLLPGRQKQAARKLEKKLLGDKKDGAQMVPKVLKGSKKS